MGSLVHAPLQYAVGSNPEQSFVNSVGLGVMGVFTRPLSGAAEFLALTGEGLLSGAGWSNLPKVRIVTVILIYLVVKQIYSVLADS